MPTPDDDDKVVLIICIGEIFHQGWRGKVNIIIMEDFNTVVGEGCELKIFEDNGLGKLKDRWRCLLKQHFFSVRKKNQTVLLEKSRCQTIPDWLLPRKRTIPWQWKGCKDTSNCSRRIRPQFTYAYILWTSLFTWGKGLNIYFKMNFN